MALFLLIKGRWDEFSAASNTRFVSATSSAESDMVKAYDSGAGSYPVKPVDFEKFTKLIDTFGFYWLAWNKYP